jgi:sugar/nucleoside kinase (ribokinase family)
LDPQYSWLTKLVKLGVAKTTYWLGCTGRLNALEFQQGLGIADRPINADTIRAATAGRTVQRWVVTQGHGPVWLSDAGAPPESLTPPVVTEVSATGSGDVLLAGVLHAWFRRGAALKAAVAFALPLAAANAAHPGVADFPLP